MLPMKPRANTEAVSYDASVASAAFTAETTVIRVVATTNCHIKFAAAPTATTSNIYLPAGVVEYFLVTPSTKVAAIKASGGTAGILYVTEMTK
jgi:hypothetical protein